MQSELTGEIFNIQRFSIYDGPGIRTNVFLKGCPLHCRWCHNPESIARDPEIAFYADKCIQCGACMSCPNRCHSFGESHQFLRDVCAKCGQCALSCATGALEVIGERKTVDEVLKEVLKDEAFYRNSGGGMTLSGGEPFFQPDFSIELLRRAKEAGVHTCVETCGAAPLHIVKEAAAVTDLFLFDVKETDEARHVEFTGVSGAALRRRLELLSELGANIILRCPIIPSLNDRESHFSELGALAERLTGVLHVEIEPYHPLGVSKSQAMGKKQEEFSQASPEQQAKWVEAVQMHTQKLVRLS